MSGDCGVVAGRIRSSFESREAHSRSDRCGNAAWWLTTEDGGMTTSEGRQCQGSSSREMMTPAARQRGENGSASRMSRQMTMIFVRVETRDATANVDTEADCTAGNGRRAKRRRSQLGRCVYAGGKVVV